MMADRTAPVCRAQSNGASGTTVPSAIVLRVVSNLSKA